MQDKLIRFLQDDLGISPDQLRLAMSRVQQMPNQLPMILWQYGLINLNQLDQIFDWLETAF